MRLNNLSKLSWKRRGCGRKGHTPIHYYTFESKDRTEHTNLFCCKDCGVTITTHTTALTAPK